MVNEYPLKPYGMLRADTFGLCPRWSPRLTRTHVDRGLLRRPYHPQPLAIVHGCLDDIEIASCGRYGAWGYMLIGRAFPSGERAARGVAEAARDRQLMSV